MFYVMETFELLRFKLSDFLDFSFFLIHQSQLLSLFHFHYQPRPEISFWDVYYWLKDYSSLFTLPYTWKTVNEITIQSNSNHFQSLSIDFQKTSLYSCSNKGFDTLGKFQESFYTHQPWYHLTVILYVWSQNFMVWWKNNRNHWLKNSRSNSIRLE